MPGGRIKIEILQMEFECTRPAVCERYRRYPNVGTRSLSAVVGGIGSCVCVASDYGPMLPMLVVSGKLHGGGQVALVPCVKAALSHKPAVTIVVSGPTSTGGMAC
jgi:hypothetical protein